MITNRALRKTIIATVAVLALAWTGCEVNTASILILQNQVPSNDCIVDSTSTANYLTNGVLDVSFRTASGGYPGYWVYPLIKNNLQPTEDPAAGVSEQNCLIMERATVDLDLGSLAGFVEFGLTHYRVDLFMTIFPGESKVAAVPVILPAVTERIAGQTTLGGTYGTATIRIIAKRGTQEIESAPMRWPILVCNGCLLRVIGDCGSVSPEGTLTGNPCNPGQDFPMHCCDDSGVSICPIPEPVEPTTP